MKRVALGVAVLFALVGFSLPCAAQYWPDMRDFNIPSTKDVVDVRVKEALQQGKYRAEIEALRKITVTKSAAQSKDLDIKISTSLKNTIKDINAYVAKMKACAQTAVSDKSYCTSAYALVPVYEDINNFSAAAEDLNKYLATVEKCGALIKAQHINVNVAQSCKNVISNKTYGYSKIMEISFKHNDRDNFFNANKALSGHFKAIK